MIIADGVAFVVAVVNVIVEIGETRQRIGLTSHFSILGQLLSK